MKLLTRKELFEKYKINESHKNWDMRIDNWMSIEIYRLMHNGNLPDENDLSNQYILDFLDKVNNTEWGIELMKKRNDFGSLYLTAKRMVWRYSEYLSQN